MLILSAPPSPQGQEMLKAMQEAVRKTLERKQRLGQYAVIWQDGKPTRIGGESADTAASYDG